MDGNSEADVGSEIELKAGQETPVQADAASTELDMPSPGMSPIKTQSVFDTPTVQKETQIMRVCLRWTVRYGKVQWKLQKPQESARLPNRKRM